MRRTIAVSIVAICLLLGAGFTSYSRQGLSGGGSCTGSCQVDSFGVGTASVGTSGRLDAGATVNVALAGNYRLGGSIIARTPDGGTSISFGEGFATANLGSGTGTTQYTTASGLFTKYDGLTTAGIGLDTIVASTAQKSETGADASLLSFTPPATAAQYEVCVDADITTATSLVGVGWTMTWTNSKGTALAPTNMALMTDGSATVALTVATGNTSYYACVPISVNNAAANIVVKVTYTSGTLASNWSAWIKRIS